MMGPCNLGCDRCIFDQAQADFVTRAKSNTHFKRHYSQSIDRINTNMICDHTGALAVYYSNKDYPAPLRRAVVKDESGKRITFLTNNFSLKHVLHLCAHRDFEETIEIDAWPLRNPKNHEFDHA
jgi:hypothetical protein